MQSWGYLVGISRQFRTISTIFDTPLPSSLFDSKPSGFCSCYGTYRGSGILHFTVPSPIYEPPSYSIPLYTFGFPISSAFTYEFGGFGTPLPSPLFDSKSSDFCGYYSNYRGSWYILQFTVPSPFTVPSFDLRFPLPIYGSPLSAFRLSNLSLPPLRPIMPVLRR